MARKVIGLARNAVGQRGSTRRRWSLLLSLVTAVSAAMFVKQTVLAVHDLGFELDGDVTAGNAPSPFTGTDWNQIFNANGVGLDKDGDAGTNLPTGFEHAGFVVDFEVEQKTVKGQQVTVFKTNDTTTYATGSKDTLGITPGWQCTQSSNVNSKDDIMNAYAAAFKAPGGDDILYFGMERNARTGDANIGFWFLQDEVNCASPGGSVAFTGHHKDGDIFIVSAFSNGGNVSTITAYRWNCPVAKSGQGCDDEGAATFKDTAPVAASVDCRDPLLPGGDGTCAAANRAVLTGATALPWFTANKDDDYGHTLRLGEFFEGALNLTDTGLAGKCFNVFVGNTRSSTSLTATIFDYARGQLGECTSTTVTTPSVTGSAEIEADGTNTVTDSALITVDGVDTFSGKVDFFLCGPFASDSQTLCTEGGVPAGTQTITDAAGSSTKVSDNMTVTSVGRYCWRADFTPEAGSGVPPSSDSRSSECFLITPKTATVVTQAGTTPVDLGQAVTDVATLTGTANAKGSGGPDGSTDGSINPGTAGAKAGISITFTLVKNDCTTLATGTGTNPQQVAVSGDNIAYGPVSFTPDAPGTYHWKVTYTSNTPNTIGDTHNDMCGDTNERVVVRQIPTEIKTRQDWIPNDTATITSTVGNLAAGGNAVFTLYESANCTGTVRYNQTVSVPGGASFAEVSTSNTGSGAGMFKITTLYPDGTSSKGAFSWKVVYTPAVGDSAHLGVQSSCSSATNTESFTINYHNDPGPNTP